MRRGSGCQTHLPSSAIEPLRASAYDCFPDRDPHTSFTKLMFTGCLSNRSDLWTGKQSLWENSFELSKSFRIQKSFPEGLKLLSVSRTLGLRGGGGESMTHSWPKKSITASSSSRALTTLTLSLGSDPARGSLIGGERTFVPC